MLKKKKRIHICYRHKEIVIVDKWTQIDLREKLISHHLTGFSRWLTVLDLPFSFLLKTNGIIHANSILCCSQDELARVLVTLFDSRHLLYQLLWNMFSKEVELADSMQTLFRGNSLASKIMTFCFKVCIRLFFCVRAKVWQIDYVQNVQSRMSLTQDIWRRRNKFLLVYFFRYMVLPTYKNSWIRYYEL